MINDKNMNDKKKADIEAIDIESVVIVDEQTEVTDVTDVVVQPEAQTNAITSAANWEEKIKIADAMIEGGLVPRSFAGDPGAVISAVEMGGELGLSPWASLNNITVIQGRATLSLNAMLSLARAKGVLINVTKDYVLVPLEIKTKEGIKKSSDRCTTIVVTRGEDIHSPSGKLLDSRISEYTYTKCKAEAKLAELTGKENWKKMPRLMLRARCITEALRLYAPDIILGMYESTEIGDPNNIIVDIKE